MNSKCACRLFIIYKQDISNLECRCAYPPPYTVYTAVICTIYRYILILTAAHPFCLYRRSNNLLVCVVYILARSGNGHRLSSPVPSIWRTSLYILLTSTIACTRVTEFTLADILGGVGDIGVATPTPLWILRKNSPPPKKNFFYRNRAKTETGLWNVYISLILVCIQCEI